MNSPAVMLLGSHVASAYHRARDEAQGEVETAGPEGEGPTQAYLVFGRAGEIGQIYTSVAGLLNLLCIVNAIYVAHQRAVEGAHA